MVRNALQILTVCVLFIVNGCVATPKPQLVYQAGLGIETLSATISLSVSKGEQGMGSGGYLLYQRPNRMRVVILSPFGTTMMEAITTDGQITIVNTSKGVAFRGRLEDLPLKGEGEIWRHARWVMDIDPPGSSIRDGSMDRVNSLGDNEEVIFAGGVVVSKRLKNGDMVHYGDYELVSGIPLASEIIMDSHDGGRFRIKITEPEVNTDLAPDAFTPHLERLTVYPLSVLQEP
jgi:hypothetical protein